MTTSWRRCGGARCAWATAVVHKVNHDGCRLARDMGAELHGFRHDDPAQLEQQLMAHRDKRTRLIVVEDVLSTTGRVPDLRKLAEVARRHDAILYIDDAHGFGVLGENPTPEQPFGMRGNRVIRHLGLSYNNILDVSGHQLRREGLTPERG